MRTTAADSRLPRTITTAAAITLLALAGVLWWGRSAAHGGQTGQAGQAGQAAPAAARSSARTETALFSMYCYWTGEASLGLVPGVTATRIGSMGGEVVEVTYDPARTDLGKLAGSLRRHGGFYSLIVPDAVAKAKALAEAGGALASSEIQVREGRPRFLESKYSLRTSHPELAALDLTESQAIALNAWSYFGGPRPDVLTPEQKEQLGRK